MAVTERITSTDILMPYRGWMYPGTSGVSADERAGITWMYAGITLYALVVNVTKVSLTLTPKTVTISRSRIVGVSKSSYTLTPKTVTIETNVPREVGVSKAGYTLTTYSVTVQLLEPVDEWPLGINTRGKSLSLSTKGKSLSLSTKGKSLSMNLRGQTWKS